MTRFLIFFALIFVVCGCGQRRAPVSPPPSNFGIRFENSVPADGISFRWPVHPRPLGTKESFGTGCAFLDFDNDGFPDILLVAKPHPILYHNEKNGKFRDVTAAMGIGKVTGDWRGVAVGDYDGDGYLDVLLTGFHQLALLKNRRGESFGDVTREAGLSPKNDGHWGSSAGWMDLDGDGRLDLVILNYVVFGPNTKNLCEQSPGILSGCPPKTYKSEFPELWKNVGGKFQNVTASSGLKAAHGTELVLAFADVNGDGKPDFYIGSDGLLADLFVNRGNMTFGNIGTPSGIDTTESGQTVSSMGADWGDYDRDGKLDLAVSNFSELPYQLYRHADGDLFDHEESATGLANATIKSLGFGVKWADMDNDGWPDLIFANGHVYDNPGKIDGFSQFRQPIMLFHNENGRQFVDLAPTLGGALTSPILGRGLATGDYDNDGRMDALVVDYEGAPLLLHNQSKTSNHWLTLDLRAAFPNRFAYGASVTASAGHQKWVGYVSPASSYLSSSDPRIHFGLGGVNRLDTLVIRWPDGTRQTQRDVSCDRVLRVSEAKKVKRP